MQRINGLTYEVVFDMIVCRKVTHHWLWIWIPGLPWLWHCKLLQWTCRLWMRLQLVSCICIFFKKCSGLLQVARSWLWLAYLCWFWYVVYQTNTVVTEFVSVIFAGTQTRKSSSTFSDITFILENLKRWKPYKICFALLVFVTFSHVSRPHMFWMVVTGLGSRAGRVLCGVQLLFTCFSSVLGHLGNCSGKFH